jgi:hypothetical protein
LLSVIDPFNGIERHYADWFLVLPVELLVLPLELRFHAGVRFWGAGYHRAITSTVR